MATKFNKLYRGIIAEMNDEIMNSLGFSAQVADKNNGICPSCRAKVDVNEFRDDVSKNEFKISGLCQKCQDETFGSGDEEEEDCENCEDCICWEPYDGHKPSLYSRYKLDTGEVIRFDPHIHTNVHIVAQENEDDDDKECEDIPAEHNPANIEEIPEDFREDQVAPIMETKKAKKIIKK